MGTSFGSYEIARSGMSVNERGLFVTGHNISNANTVGYVRQQACISSAAYSTEGKYQIGLGADIEQIRQIRFSFLDNMYRQENTTLGYWETRSKTFQDIQGIMGEPLTPGLQDAMNQFWDSWQELSKEPDSLTARAMVRQRAQNLTYQVNHLGSQIDKLQSDLNSELCVRIDEVNQITRQIAKLNGEILKAECAKDTANDYRDQRNSLVDRLTKLVDPVVQEDSDGMFSVSVGGYFIVDKDHNNELSASPSTASGTFDVPKFVANGIELPVKGGIIKGLMESRGEVDGSKGSIGNGTPNTKADITYVVDVSNGSSANLAKIKSSVANSIDELKRKGIDYNLRIVLYKNGVSDYKNFGKDDSSFMNYINTSPNYAQDGAATANNFGSVVTKLNSITDFVQDANKYALVFTGESIDGNEVNVTTASGVLQGYIDTLNSKGIKTSVVTTSANASGGDPAGGWDKITGATGGNFYDISTAAADYPALMRTIADDVNADINKDISSIPEGNNIISEIRSRLNAIVNVMARELNYIHRSGKTMNAPPNDQGQDFFVAIDSSRAMEMGNIKLNDNIIQDLDCIVAATTMGNGDNTIAKKIASLREESLMDDNEEVLNLDDYYQGLILKIGNGGADAERIADNQQKLVLSADNYRQSISGVSMDEEMTSMMKYKFGYDAAARAINVIDQMMETIISRLGVVGR